MVAAVLGLAVAACGAEAVATPASPATAAPAQRELGLYPGETMAFEVKLGGLLVGDAQLAVGELGAVEGRSSIAVRSRVATAGAAALIRKISDEATSVVDVATGRPLSVQTDVWQGDKHITSASTFVGQQAKIRYQRGDAAPVDVVVNFGATELHDAHTAMAAIRSWRPRTGERRTVFVVGGRRIWRVDVTAAGTESIGTELGNRRAIVLEGVGFRARRNLTVEGKAPARTFKVWLSDDADRVPLRVTATTELGQVEMALTDYTRP